MNNDINSLREAVAYLRATKLSKGLTASEYKMYDKYKRELKSKEKKSMEDAKMLRLTNAN